MAMKMEKQVFAQMHHTQKLCEDFFSFKNVTRAGFGEKVNRLKKYQGKED